MNAHHEADDAAIIAFFKKHPEKLPQLREMRAQLQEIIAVMGALVRDGHDRC